MSDLWSSIRRDILRRLNEHAPGMPFEERVMLAEDAARNVLKAITEFALPQAQTQGKRDDS